MALLITFVVGGCFREEDAVVVPAEHPANPYAQPASAIRVPAITTKIAPVTPDPAKEAPQSPSSPDKQQAPRHDGAHQHEH